MTVSDSEKKEEPMQTITRHNEISDTKNMCHWGSGGGCQQLAIPPARICKMHETQEKRVASFLLLHPRNAKGQVASKTAEITPAPAGHTWLCQACGTEQPSAGMHCGFKIILIEAGQRNIERDSSGRIVAVRSADQTSLYRRCPDCMKSNTWCAKHIAGRK